MHASVDILYEDDQLLAVSKPAGLLTIPDRFAADKPSLVGFLQKKYERVWTVHRLDRETSGVLCFARSEEAHRHLSIQFEKHTVDKYYQALVDGVMHHDEGEIDKPIGEHPTIPGKMTVLHNGKPSQTEYSVLERFQRFTWVEVLLKTGRTHQIRVHFQSIGYPLLVDALYGRRASFSLSEIKGRSYKSGKFSTEERPLLERTALHASRLCVEHPTTGARMCFDAPLPKDLHAVVQQLRKWGK